MGGETCPKMDFNPTTIRHGRVSREHLHLLQQANALDRFVNHDPNALFFIISGFF